MQFHYNNNKHFNFRSVYDMTSLQIAPRKFFFCFFPISEADCIFTWGGSLTSIKKIKMYTMSGKQRGAAVIGMKAGMWLLCLSPSPPCTLQGRAATGGEAAVHHRGNWPWFIGGQSSQRELAQHWQEARQGHAVNISKPTQTQPKPPTAGTPLPRISCHHAEEVHVCECMFVCISCSVCSCICVFVFRWVTRVAHKHRRRDTHTQTHARARRAATKNDKQSP